MTRSGAFDDGDSGGDEVLAAEYVVGVLGGDERAAVTARIADDPDFARLVERWQANLSPMDDGFEAVEPPASVKRALDARLFSSTAGAAGTQAARGSLWGSLAFWRGLTAAAVLALAIFAARPYLDDAPPPDAGARLVASLAPQDSDVHYLAIYDARNADIGLSHVTGAAGDGRDFELWVIESGQAPASLGVIPAGSSVHMAVDEALRRKIDQGAVFAISLEPAGGSTTGLPTGPVVAAGNLRGI